MENLRRADVIIHQLGDRQIDVRHFFLVDAFDQAGEPRQIFVGQRQLDAIAKLGPFGAGEGAVRRRLNGRTRIELQDLLQTHDAAPLPGRDAFSACPDCDVLRSSSLNTGSRATLRDSRAQADDR